MPDMRGALPVGVLAKGSISQLVKATRLTTTEPSITDMENHLWFELENNVFTDKALISMEPIGTAKTLPIPVKNTDASTEQAQTQETQKNQKPLPDPPINETKKHLAEAQGTKEPLPSQLINTGTSTDQMEGKEALPNSNKNTDTSTNPAKIKKLLEDSAINTDASKEHKKIKKPLPISLKNTGSGKKQTKNEKLLPEPVINTYITANKIAAEFSNPSSQNSSMPIQNNSSNSLADTNNDENLSNFLNQLRESYYKRIIVKTCFSVYFDGILTSVNDDFIILITDQLSIVSIPLLCIASFYILTP